jgi:hypothetical protein
MAVEAVTASDVAIGDEIRVSDHQWGIVTEIEGHGSWVHFVVSGYCHWWCPSARRVARKAAQPRLEGIR